MDRSAPTPRRGPVLVAAAVLLTAFNLRTAVNSVGPVLEEIEAGLGIGSTAAGLVTTMPLLCFAVLGFAGPPLAARFRDGHVLAAALAVMALGLLGRAVAGSFWLFLLGTVATMVGGALGNVLLPGIVKHWFPHRQGLLVGAYSATMAVGGAVATSAAAPVAAAVGVDGWRWSLGIWTVFALVAVAPWLLVPRRGGTASRSGTGVSLRQIARAPLSWQLIGFFGLQAMQAYVIVGWTAQYLRDSGMAAATAGALLGLQMLLVIPVNAIVPPLVVRQAWQRPLLLAFLACYLVGWLGLLLAPLTLTLLWMGLLGLGMGTFAMVLALYGQRARTPETVAGLSTVVQGGGYALAALGPLLVGFLRGVTGGYTGMFALVLGALLVMAVLGWLVCADRFVDDELPGRPASGARGTEPSVGTAGVESPVVLDTGAGGHTRR